MAINSFEIFWTAFASRCLEEIKEYILKQTFSKKTAVGFVLKLMVRVEQLRDFPESGAKEELLKQFNQNSRFLVEGNYKIIYQFDGSKIIITDVFMQNEIRLKSKSETRSDVFFFAHSDL